MGHMENGTQSATSEGMRACLPSKSGDPLSEAVALPRCGLMHLSGKDHGLCGSPPLFPLLAECRPKSLSRHGRQYIQVRDSSQQPAWTLWLVPAS